MPNSFNFNNNALEEVLEEYKKVILGHVLRNNIETTAFIICMQIQMEEMPMRALCHRAIKKYESDNNKALYSSTDNPTLEEAINETKNIIKNVHEELIELLDDKAQKSLLDEGIQKALDFAEKAIKSRMKA